MFKVPGTESYLPGDINSDGRIDENDLTSYTNYTGLRRGDSDFEGYVSVGDINRNDLIDAYDISVVATRLEDGVDVNDYADPLAGEITFDMPRGTFAAGDTATVTVKGTGLKSVNAISLAIPYDQKRWQFVGVETVNTGNMRDLTNDRLHTNGTRQLYPTFVNVGEQPDVVTEGDEAQPLFRLRFRALQRGAFNATPRDGMIVDKKLNTIAF